MKLPCRLCWFSLELVSNLSSSLLNADRQERAGFGSAEAGRDSWGQIFGSGRPWTVGGDTADEHSELWHSPEISLVWRPAGAFPPHGCHPQQPDYTGRSSNLMDASVFVQIKQFQQDGGKKPNPVMSRKKTWPWASCTKMSTCMCIFLIKKTVLILMINKPSSKSSGDGFPGAFRLFTENFD